MPPSRTLPDDAEEMLDVLPVMNGWVRGTLIGLALGMTTVFAIALWLNPYENDGTPRWQGTHEQLGLATCTFYRLTKVPCPSCGMTTSFSLLARGDLVNSVRANFAGSFGAVVCFGLIPWGFVSAYKQRTIYFRSMEKTAVLTVVAFLFLMMARWFLVIGWVWWSGGS